MIPNQYYRLIMRTGCYRRVGRCFRLRLQELNLEEASAPKSVIEEDSHKATHVVSFYDFEHVRAYAGWIKEASEDKLVFSLGEGKEYEFRPIVPPRD